MGRITEKFNMLRGRNEKALIVYLTAGDPSLAVTKKLILGLADAGVDIMEIGVPFSDPTADGPVIQAASQRALKAGTTLQGVLDLVADIRETIADSDRALRLLQSDFCLWNKKVCPSGKRGRCGWCSGG